MNIYIDEDFNSVCAGIHEKLAGSPLAQAFAQIQIEAKAWIMFSGEDLSDFEYEVVKPIEERAGVLWRCPATANFTFGEAECDALNFYNEDSCCDCGSPRPIEMSERR